MVVGPIFTISGAWIVPAIAKAFVVLSNRRGPFVTIAYVTAAAHRLFHAPGQHAAGAIAGHDHLIFTVFSDDDHRCKGEGSFVERVHFGSRYGLAQVVGNLVGLSFCLLELLIVLIRSNHGLLGTGREAIHIDQVKRPRRVSVNVEPVLDVPRVHLYVSPQSRAVVTVSVVMKPGLWI